MGCPGAANASHDTDPHEPGGDATGEDYVNAADLAAFRSGAPSADFTGDGYVVAADLAVFRGNVGRNR